MKIGLFGGMFNPIHFGHLVAAEHVLQQLRLDEVWFVPSKQPPHKRDDPALAEHRVRMVERAIAGHPHFKVSRVEFELANRRSYTCDSVARLQRMFPKVQFYLAIGSDVMKGLPRWRNIAEFVHTILLVHVSRSGYDPPQLPDFIRDRTLNVDVPDIALSSTHVRTMVRDGRSIRYLVPESVRRYIIDHKLYEPADKYP